MDWCTLRRGRFFPFFILRITIRFEWKRPFLSVSPPACAPPPPILNIYFLPLLLSHSLSFFFFLDTLIYSVHCCFNRPLCPGVGIITELPSRLIGLEPAITSVLLEYTDTQTLACALKRQPPALILLLVSQKNEKLQWLLASATQWELSRLVMKCLLLFIGKYTWGETQWCTHT